MNGNRGLQHSTGNKINAAFRKNKKINIHKQQERVSNGIQEQQ
jgi:hypothetical protein